VHVGELGVSQRSQTDALALMIFLIISLMPQGYFLMLYSPVMISTHYSKVLLYIYFLYLNLLQHQLLNNLIFLKNMHFPYTA